MTLIGIYTQFSRTSWRAKTDTLVRFDTVAHIHTNDRLTQVYGQSVSAFARSDYGAPQLPSPPSVTPSLWGGFTLRVGLG